ncbi:hypothetical protein E2C01_086045 [Portunus trituberculatus]|uniref:Uncharacterized protein n=1 Tax=Portunus trituberculatus TaxID=210409 RepID=A0A5B7J8M0_PORTR|nr:hypothetical protein [Portunus trituberculatus]
MANGGRNLENGRDHYFHYPTVDILLCPGSPFTDFIGATAHRSHVPQRYLLTRDPQPYCDDCLVSLTVRHLVAECPSLTDLRHRGVYYISKVLEPECLVQSHDVFRFLGEAGLLAKL